jgi:hypothetical protein
MKGVVLLLLPLLLLLASAGSPHKEEPPPSLDLKHSFWHVKTYSFRHGDPYTTPGVYQAWNLTDSVPGGTPEVVRNGTRIILQPGSYRMHATASVYAPTPFSTRLCLYKVNTGGLWTRGTVAIGAAGTTASSVFMDVVDIDETTSFELHQVMNVTGLFGFDVAVDPIMNMYMMWEIQKVA